MWIWGVRKATEKFGDAFGEKRMTELYWIVIEELHKMRNRYDYHGDGSHYYAMRQYLKTHNIDVEALWKEGAIRGYKGKIEEE